jgi:hypothetical protein
MAVAKTARILTRMMRRGQYCPGLENRFSIPATGAVGAATSAISSAGMMPHFPSCPTQSAPKTISRIS